MFNFRVTDGEIIFSNAETNENILKVKQKPLTNTNIESSSSSEESSETIISSSQDPVDIIPSTQNKNNQSELPISTNRNEYINMPEILTSPIPESPSPSIASNMESPKPYCSFSPRPPTPGKILSSITPRKITYSGNDIRSKLEKAGLYITIKENIPELIEYRKSLHQAEELVLTPKTKQKYNNLRKILYYSLGEDALFCN